ncbi:hypothetical protein LSAT2_030909 [Lamellibrachia satsuma]|nr:hypothetical protein LSAT2_030909 [Lamellibrachia satsuma]
MYSDILFDQEELFLILGLDSPTKFQMQEERRTSNNFQSAVYLTRSSADKHLGRETKQQFILDSQSDNLWISPNGSYQIEKEWSQDAKLGSGAYGECFAAQDKTSKFIFCVKSILGWSCNKEWTHAFREANTLCHLDDPRIVEFYGILFSPTHFWIIMEYVPGQSLSQCFDGGRKSSLHLCLHILRQLLQCAVYLKEKNVTHGDIKFDNIMIRNDGSIKLVDFGNSVQLCAYDLQSVLFTFVHLIALSKPWREYYKGTTLLRKLIDTKRLPPIGPPGMPDKVVEVIKNGLGFNTNQHSAAELLNMVSIDFIINRTLDASTVKGLHADVCIFYISLASIPDPQSWTADTPCIRDDAVSQDPIFREPVDLQPVEDVIPSAEIPATVEELVKNKKRKTADKSKKEKNYRNQVVIPYVEGVSLRSKHVLKKYGVTTAMRPHTTLRRMLVHPKDKVEPEEQDELVYQILCQSCGAAYIGETGRLFKARLNEHKKDVENAQKEQYMRSEKKWSQSTTTNDTAFTYHSTNENRIIDWEGVKVVYRESH